MVEKQRELPGVSLDLCCDLAAQKNGHATQERQEIVSHQGIMNDCLVLEFEDSLHGLSAKIKGDNEKR